MSAQDKLDRRAAKHGLGSDERKRKIQKAKDFFSKPVPTYSKDELRKMGHPVESAKVPAGMKFIASYVYKDANGNKHTHRHLRKGTKMTDPVVVHIDGKEWKTFQSFTKAKQAAINHIKGMKESVEMEEGMFDIKIPAPKGSNKNTDKQIAAKAARRAANRAKTNKVKIDKAMAKDVARSASGSLKRTDDHRRKNYQSGKSGAYFSKYESTAEYEAYRKPTQAEIDADKRKDGKSKDSSTRYRDMKKKMYGNAMGGLKNESVLGEATWKRPFKGHDWGNKDGMLMHTGKKLRKNPKLKGGVKKLYVHHTNKLSVIAVTDDKKSVQLIKGVPDGFTGRVDVFNDIATLAYHYGLKPVRPGDKHTEFTASGVKANESTDNYKMESADLEEKYAVKYTHPTDKKSGRTTGPMSKAAADKKAAMGNRVDRVGGKYTVIPHVEAAGQEYTAVPIKTGDVSQADRLTIAKMDAIMKKRSKDKRQKESVELDENKIFFVKVGDGRGSMTVKTKAKNSREALKKMRAEHPKSRVSLDINQKQGKPAGTFESSWKADSARRMRNQRIANEPYRGPSEPDTRTDAERMADRAKLAKRFAADKAKQDKAVASKKESVATADRKPQNYRDPETGKLKTRMIPVNRDVVRGNDKARVVRKKRFKHMRKEQMATGNSRVGKDGRDAFMKAFKDIQKTAAEIQKKKDADKK